MGDLLELEVEEPTLEERFAGLDGKLHVKGKEDSRTTFFNNQKGGGDASKTWV